MELTQIELDQIKKQIRYDGETGHFFYLQDRFIQRKFAEEMASPKPPKKVHSAGDRADKQYGQRKPYIGVYVLDRVINAAHLALFFLTGHWPEAVKYRNGDWGDMTAPNLEPRTRSQQTTEAAQARYEGQSRKLPANIYATSSGHYVAKKGNLKSKEYESIREAVQALNQGRWLR